jgi:Ca-activated chloride channel family protein
MRLLVLLVLLVPALGVVQQPTFRSKAELVLLPVTARDSSGRVVKDLVAADFHVFENGRPQRLSVFSGDRVPTALSLLLDTSASMEPNLGSAQAAAEGIVARLRQQDVAEVIAFNNSVDIRQDFTPSHALLRSAIASTRADGATSLYNAVYIALRSLQRSRPSNEGDLRREAIVVLSDGDDTSSVVAFDDVLDAARRSQTLIYTIALQPIGDATRLRMRDGLYVLRQLADQTGGKSYTVTNIHQLDDVYGEIYEAIAASYMLGYIPVADAPGGAWRTLSVAVDRPGVVARTRAGYFRN